MKDIKKLISTVVVTIIVFMLAIATISQAAADYNNKQKLEEAIKSGTLKVGQTIGPVGKNSSSNFINLEGQSYSPYLYCIQRGKMLPDGMTYKVTHSIEIVGNKAIFDNKTAVGEPHYHDANAILAYIIAGEKSGANYGKKGYGESDNSITFRQLAMWKYWNTWAEKAQKKLGVNYIWDSQKARSESEGNYHFNGNVDGLDEAFKEFKPYYEQLIDDAKEYAQKENTIAEIKLQGNNNNQVKSVGTNDDKQLVGPIEINFKGTLFSITAKATDDSEIKNLEFYDSNKNKLEGIKDIKSEQAFYIKTSNNKTVKNINFAVKAESTIKAKIWIIEGTKSTQRLIITDGKTEPTNAELNVTVKPEEEGDIVIHKQDVTNKKALEGAEFKVFIGEREGGSHWLSVDNTGAYSYTSNYQNAKVFTSDADGNVLIKNLKTGYQISIFETKAPNGYELKEQEGYETNENRVLCTPNYFTVNTTKQEGTITLTKDNVITITNTKAGDLEIIKTDKTSAEKLEGAEFKISAKAQGNKEQNTWLKQNNDGTYNYTSSFKEATTFITGKEGNVLIKDLEPQRYYIYETKAPTGYELQLQDNYDSQNEWVVCGNREVSSGKKVQVTIENAEIISIEGYVWIEKPGTKANEYNDIVDNGEEIITDKVTITLRKKSDNSIVAENPIIVKETAYKGTDHAVEVDCYRFEKVDYNKLNEYYVHFDYSKDYSDYITVTSNFDLAEGSKAISDNVPDYDKDLIGMANTYKGTTDEAKYGLSGLATKFYDESTYTLKNINLGIKELPETPFTVSENLAYVDMKIKGYNYRYIYGGTGAKLQTVPTVKFQSKTDKESYTRSIYPSDIIYENPQDKTQELQVYATYRIDVTNNTDLDIQYLYQEKDLNVTSVLNKYDTNRYELADSNWVTTENSTVVKMKDEYRQKQYYDEKGNGISNESEKNNKYAYITFKIIPNALKVILKSKYGTIEDFPVTAAVTAYHTYTRIDSSWENNRTKTQTHYTREKTQTDEAPYLWTPLEENNRTISGKVFEDKNSKTNGELVGNGMYDENENKVKNVTVELGNFNSEGRFVATDLYTANEDGTTYYDENGNLPKASVKTSTDGTYSFAGVVPGEYLLRYTYGDGTQKIVDSNGNEINAVSSDKYKSTIVTEEIRKAFETNYEATKALWYLEIGENHNIAVDDLTMRANSSKDRYTVISSSINNTSASSPITAQTPEFSIPIEFKASDEGSAEDQYPSELGYMDFGIIEIPKTRIDISKKITNIKITLQNGQVLLEGNPGKQNIAYTTDLDKKTDGGSIYVKVELDTNNIYGSTLEIKYEIEVINNSDLDYIEEEGSKYYGYYYKYGDSTYAEEKKVEVTEVYDYLDPKISYKSKEGTQTIETVELKSYRHQEDDKIPNDVKQILSLVKEIEDENGNDLEYEKILKITDFGALSSSKGSYKENSSSTINIIAEKILTSQDDDLEFINIAEVTKVKTEPITPANIEFPEAEKTNAEITTTITGTKIAKTPKVTLTVTPSTGGDRNMLYFVAGTIALAVIAGGIVLIKKRVLK